MIDHHMSSKGAAVKGARPWAIGGFTLIELMIAIVIVGILMSIAVASYGFAMGKSRRATAQACVIEGAQYMERYYTTNFSYAGATLPACSADVTSHYTVAFVTTPTATAFTISATPQGGQVGYETQCATMTINQLGQKTPTSGCW